MADKQVRIHLSETGAEQTAAAIGKVDGALKGMAGQALAVGAAYFSAAGLINGLTASVRAAGEAERAQARLDTALGRHSKSLEAYAKARMRATTFDDDATISAMALIATHVKSEKQIKRLTQAAQDLAAKLGMDLDSAAQLINKTIGAEGAGALARYGVHLDENKNKIDAVVEALQKYAGGQAEAQAATDSGKLQQLANAWGNVGEMIGGPVTKALVWLGQSTEQWFNQIAAGTRVMGSLLPGGGSGMPGLNDDELPTGPERGAWRAKAAEWEKGAADRAEKRAAATKAVVEQEINLLNLHQLEIAAYEKMLRDEDQRLNNLYEMSSFGEEAHLARMEQMQIEMDNQRAILEEDQEWLDRLAADDVQRVKNRRDAYLDFAATTVSSLAAVNSALKGSKAVTLALMQAEGGIMAIKAGINTTEEMSKYLPFPLPQIMGATVAAGQLAQVAQMGRYDSGGYITGHGGTRSDSVPAMLSAGEGVLNASAVARIGGEAAIHALNNGRRVTNDGVQIHFNGPITDRDYVRDFLVPEIRKAVSRA